MWGVGVLILSQRGWTLPPPIPIFEFSKIWIWELIWLKLPPSHRGALTGVPQNFANFFPPSWQRTNSLFVLFFCA